MPKAAQKIETREVPMLDFRAAPVPESYNEKKRTVTFVASTGARGLRRRFWGEDYYEELDISTDGIRMNRLNNGAPFLNSHSSYGVHNVLGAVSRAWVENGELMVDVKFSKREEVAPILADIADGILRHVSVGYMVHEYTEIGREEDDKKILRATDWEPMEVSLVPIPFDDGAVSRSADVETSQAKITTRAAGPTTEEESDMTTNRKKKTPAATETPDPVNEGMIAEDEAQRNAEAAATAAAEAAIAAERQRSGEIRAAVRSAKLGDDFADTLINDGVEMDEARKRIIDAWGAQDDSEPTRGVRSGVDHEVVQNMRTGATNALLVRGGVQGVELTDEGREFRGMSLGRLCEDILSRQGVSTRGLTIHEIATRALSTSDLANIAGSVFNRTLLQGYESAPRTFVGVFRQGTASDFRAVNRVRLSGAPALDEVKENGEFKYGKVTDEKETYSLATYGKILPFTRQTIVNDDMDALVRIPSMFGRAAADLESDIVWAILEDNANLQDGVALFDAGHNNLAGSGQAISVATVGAAREAMRKQTGMEGRVINIMPRHIIVPANEETVLDQFMADITPATTANAVPSALRSLNPVVEPRLADNAWYVAADYMQVDTLEYMYLEGNQGVYIETQEGFDIDGIKIKARHDFAAKAIDYRGLYKNPGA